MPRNDQAVRQLIILKKLESSRHGLTLQQLAEGLDPSAVRVPRASGDEPKPQDTGVSMGGVAPAVKGGRGLKTHRVLDLRTTHVVLRKQIRDGYCASGGGEGNNVVGRAELLR